MTRRHREWKDWEVRARLERWLRRLAHAPGLRLEDRPRRNEGLNHANYFFSVKHGGALDDDLQYTLRLPGDQGCYTRLPSGSFEEGMALEAETLRRLGGQVGEFATPRLMFFEERAPEWHGQPAMLLTVCGGGSIEQTVLGHRAEEYCGLLGEALAAVHALPLPEFDHLPRHETTNHHLLAEAERVPRSLRERDPVGLAAMRCVRAALAEPPEPCSVVHGDLLPQNVVQPMAGADRYAVLDWEFARVGDPAYDFSLLFRGGRKVLGVAGGRQLVTDAYAGGGGRLPSPLRVGAYELLLLLRWVAEGGGSAEHYRSQVLSLCRRLAGPAPHGVTAGVSPSPAG